MRKNRRSSNGLMGISTEEAGAETNARKRTLDIRVGPNDSAMGGVGGIGLDQLIHSPS